ncbi:MAG: hypothetical protein JSV64_05725 [Candidatus Bathyarchaeota archaeon]|nr:MAG: hypothetical protein JSV64_05725 [Candidatus Bathyarchaeota archaeon]
MNKKVLMPFMALLASFAVAPLVAAPAVKIPYTADVSLEITDPGESWIMGGILQVRGLIAVGTFDSADLGISGATMWKKLDYTLNTITGKGTMHGIFVLTVDGVGTFEGSFRDKITDSTHLAGTVVGQGTGAFEGVKTMGIWYGDIIDGTIENVLEAQLLFPKG